MARKKMVFNQQQEITLAEGCEKYLNYCKQRNLRAESIRHYHYNFSTVIKYFGEDMPLSSLNEEAYNEYISHLQSILKNDITIYSYARDFRTLMHFLQKEGEVEIFSMQNVRKDTHPVETYSDEEIRKLLKKPNVKKCTFNEYECWVMSNFLFCTGLRQRSLINIQVKDLDLECATLNVMHTKNRKPLIIPLNSSLVTILKEFIKIRNPKDEEDWLFCNSFGEKLTTQNHYKMMCVYNRGREVDTVGIHRWRHTMAKNWVLNNGSVTVLSKLLGHSDLRVTSNYVNLLVSDLAAEVEEIDLLGKYSSRKSIKMK